MKRSYYIFTSGTIKRKDNTVQFIDSEGKKKDLPVNDMDVLYVFSEMTFNTKLINFFSQNGIMIHFFNYYGFYSGTFCPKETLNSGHLLVNQTRHYYSSARRLKIAGNILESATYNILHNLKYYAQRGNEELAEEITNIVELRGELTEQKDINSLMAIEGNIRKNYYRCFNKVIKRDVEFKARIKHPPDNMMNSLISFTNSLIYTTVLSEIYKTQLSPLISFLHEPGVRRYSLSLDIAEIFKPLIGDRMIFSLLNKKQITENSFDKDLNFTHLTEKGKKVILREYDERLNTTVRHKTLKRNVSYRKLIRLDLYKLVKHILGEKEFEGFKIWW